MKCGHVCTLYLYRKWSESVRYKNEKHEANGLTVPVKREPSWLGRRIY